MGVWQTSDENERNSKGKETTRHRYVTPNSKTPNRVSFVRTYRNVSVESHVPAIHEGSSRAQFFPFSLSEVSRHGGRSGEERRFSPGSRDGHGSEEHAGFQNERRYGKRTREGGREVVSASRSHRNATNGRLQRLVESAEQAAVSAPRDGTVSPKYYASQRLDGSSGDGRVGAGNGQETVLSGNRHFDHLPVNTSSSTVLLAAGVKESGRRIAGVLVNARGNHDHSLLLSFVRQIPK